MWSSETKLSCIKTELKRCTMTESHCNNNNNNNNNISIIIIIIIIIFIAVSLLLTVVEKRLVLNACQL